MMHVHAHFLALREHRAIRALVAKVVRALPTDFVAVHLRQELDILAISGCISKADSRYKQAERVIANWGGWSARPLRGAVRRRASTWHCCCLCCLVLP